MAAKANLIMSNDIQVTAREIDFVTRFERNWQHLRDILGIMRPIKKQPGAVLKSKYAEGTLQSGKVAEGEEIPYSKFTVKEKNYAEMTIEKYAKAVSIEAIKDHGYENAVQMTDDEFLFQLQTDVTGRFYDYLKTGTLTYHRKQRSRWLWQWLKVVLRINSSRCTEMRLALLDLSTFWKLYEYLEQLRSPFRISSDSST